MSIEVLMPALSPTMAEGKLAKWHVKQGDVVASGDVIAEIETDKATMEIEAIDEGTIGTLLIAEGTDNVAVNTPITHILIEGEDAVTPTAAPQTPASPVSPPVTAEQVATPPVFQAAPDPDLPDGVEMAQHSVREALRDAMAEEMRRDDTVFVMGEEVGEYQGAYKVTQGLLEEFGPARVVDTPITEHGFAGLSVGAAFNGLKPVVEFMTFNFAMQALDHIVNSAAKTRYMSGGQMSCPIVFRGPNGAASRVAAQHSQDFSSWYAQVPGLTVLAPYTAADAKGLLKSAIRSPNPVIFLENEMLYGETFPIPVVDDYMVPIGKARLHKAGQDVTIVSYSRGMAYVLAAMDELATAGIDAEVIDMRSLRPLDMDSVIGSVKKTGRLVVVEEGWGICSIGSEISAQVTSQAFDYLDAPPTRVSGKNVPMPYAANLEKLALPSTQDVVAAVKAVTYG